MLTPIHVDNLSLQATFASRNCHCSSCARAWAIWACRQADVMSRRREFNDRDNRERTCSKHVRLRDLISVNIPSKIAWNHSTSVCLYLSTTVHRLQRTDCPSPSRTHDHS